MVLKIALWIVLGFVLLRIWRGILELIWSWIEAHEDRKREKRNEEIEENKSNLTKLVLLKLQEISIIFIRKLH